MRDLLGFYTSCQGKETKLKRKTIKGMNEGPITRIDSMGGSMVLQMQI
jgi:hypothetical protein